MILLRGDKARQDYSVSIWRVFDYLFVWFTHIAKGMFSAKSLFKGMFRMGIYESQDVVDHI